MTGEACPPHPIDSLHPSPLWSLYIPHQALSLKLLDLVRVSQPEPAQNSQPCHTLSTGLARAPLILHGLEVPALSQEALPGHGVLGLRVSGQSGLGVPRKCFQVLLCLWTETWNTWVPGSVLGTHFGKTSLTHMRKQTGNSLAVQRLGLLKAHYQGPGFGAWSEN